MIRSQIRDVVVVGGGIIGLACARELARAGLAVELLERRGAGAEASGAAAGLLAPLFEPGRPGPLLDAGRESRDLWPAWVRELEEESGLPVEYDASGTLAVALEENEEPVLECLGEAARAAGEPAAEISLAAARERVPDLSPAVRRVLHLPGEHRVDNVGACAALATAARRSGVILSSGMKVEKVELLEGAGGPAVRVTARTTASGCEGGGRAGDAPIEAGLLVVAAGAWSGSIPGLPALPIRPVRGQMLRLAGVSWPWGGCVRGPHGYVVRRGAGDLLVGATVEEAGFAPQVTVGGIGGLLAFARRTFPGLEGAPIAATWAGLRPGTPDDLPLVGWLPGWPALAATGHFRSGILLAPWTARQIGRLALGLNPKDVDVQDMAQPLAAFAPRRFFGREAHPWAPATPL